MQIADELCKYIGVCGLSRPHAESFDIVRYVHTEREVDSELVCSVSDALEWPLLKKQTNKKK